ncbi:MAG: hypothetical protein CL607_08870 [Anaerolineaceae bacterium]|nr:hypothetical protein [Anaerolineaceae bacterium]
MGWLRKVWGIGLLLLFAPIIYLLWYHNRPLPEPITQEMLFPGVVYTRVVEQSPRPLIYHVVQIDLQTPGLRFVATPANPTDGHTYAAQTVSQFLTANQLDLAINADFFNPWRDYGPFDYYPHVGEGVDGRCPAISNGTVIEPGYAPTEKCHSLYITMDNQASFSAPDDPVQVAVSGNVMLLVDGVYNPELAASDDPYLVKRHPRTVAAIDENGTHLLLFVVDGRQPHYSDGANMPELAEIVRRHGGYAALNLDGGGSSVLVVAGEDGQPQQLSSAIHNRIPGRERPIANHFGLVIEGQ